jgi:hypothetical protein
MGPTGPGVARCEGRVRRGTSGAAGGWHGATAGARSGAARWVQGGAAIHAICGGGKNAPPITQTAVAGAFCRPRRQKAPQIEDTAELDAFFATRGEAAAACPPATPEPLLKDQPGRHSRGVPAVEGGEGAAFAGEDMWPANLTRCGTLPIPAGET